MVVISKTFSIPQFYDSHAIAPLKDLVFLDIETTGLTPATSSIYLIGAVYHQQMEWHIRQWFSDSLNSEQEILEDFFSFIKNYQVIVSFNGETFDLPFLKKCAAAYGLNTDVLDNIRSFDLYRHLRPVKTLLQLENLKLATLESYLNISRLDQATGKEMIAVYHDYLETGDKRLYQVLLLHNEDDLKALPQIMPLLSYLDIFRSEWTLAGYSLSTASSSLTIVVDCSVKVPVAVTRELPLCRLSIRANQIIIEIRAFVGELKYFFDNYKDYYYLPDEDRAVHKKVGQYVDPEHRVQASSSTCYTKKSSTFLPLSHEDMFDLYKEEYSSKQLFTEYIADPDFILAYAHNVLEDALRCAVPVPSEEAQEAPPELFS